MALIDATQSQAIWDNRLVCNKVDNEGTFVCFEVVSSLDGFKYRVDTAADEITIASNASMATLETAIKTHLETLEYKGVKTVLTRTVKE
jgi:hypothetical protein